MDTDGDGAPDECDAACVALGMAADDDDDADGVVDGSDAFPLDSQESVDTDGDGIGMQTTMTTEMASRIVRFLLLLNGGGGANKPKEATELGNIRLGRYLSPAPIEIFEISRQP